ncbi:hypothetical protein AAFN86_06825 [Roseomonas sp. CAU 1739]|uniref:hypothetical protein n=1 Tax=Roseomonas sp. CAU 1739 TaxID=3140364 RepID=UPI00325A9D9E
MASEVRAMAFRHAFKSMHLVSIRALPSSQQGNSGQAPNIAQAAFAAERSGRHGGVTGTMTGLKCSESGGFYKNKKSMNKCSFCFEY